MNARGISLRLSVTDACQLRCRYCRPAGDGEHATRRRLSSDDLLLLVRGIHAVRGIEKLRFTGGEPLLRRDLLGLVAACAAMGIPDLALTTNAQRLAGLAGPLRADGLHRVNVSLDSLDDAVFSTITRGGSLAGSLAGIEAARRAGLRPIKLNTVVMRDLNDHEVADLLDFGFDTGCQVRFLELMPIGVAAGEFEHRFVPWREVHERLCERFELMPQSYEPGSTSRNYEARDRLGRTTVCGFISPSSRPFCQGCQRLRLTADGLLLGCLAGCGRLDLRPALDALRWGDDLPLTLAIEAALGMKRRQHDLARQRDMAWIGG